MSLRPKRAEPRGDTAHRSHPPATTRRRLLREPDGSITDAEEQRPVTLEELLDDLRSNRSFRVHRRTSGANCTVEVLAEVLYSALSGTSPRGDRPPSWATGLTDVFRPFNQR
jgi:hypothetical protein